MQIDSAKMAEACIKAAALTATALTILFWGEWIFIALVWLMAFPMALLFGLMVGFAASAIGATVTEEPEDEEEQASVWLNDEQFEKSEAILGRFGEYPIHEYIVVPNPKDPSAEKLKLMYSNTVNAENFEAPAKLWWAVLPGGLLYVEPEPENAKPA